jgi:hypothetical protein|nr:MAG TPA: ERF superfamily protein [Caudoviricetes sp.]
MASDDVKGGDWVELLMRLGNVQRDLKVPKGQFNSFGKYAYRSCEDIQQAVKPLLARESLTLVVYDSILCAGDGREKDGPRYYVAATAALLYGSARVEGHGYAREADSKKGSDVAQVTGMASSYARKYALAGLFLLDDTRDADSDGQGDGGAAHADRLAPLRRLFVPYMRATGLDQEAAMAAIAEAAGAGSIDGMTDAQVSVAVAAMDRAIGGGE